MCGYPESKGDFVLIVDELNVFLRPGGQYGKVGEFLRKNFLQKEGRFLVFSTHLPCDASIDDLMGQGTGSARHATSLALTSSRDIEALRRMDECSSLTPCQAALYSGSPGVIYTVMNKPHMTFRVVSTASPNRQP